ncbi:hypothetical protein MMPV_003617 [Pyropia vietnamensis]
MATTTCFVIAAALKAAPHLYSHPLLSDEFTVRAEAVSPEPSDIIPFPASAGEETVAGRLHTIPSLQCRTHGSGGGSSSSSNNDDGLGWVLVANSSARPVFIPYAPGTCASPLSDAFQLQYLADPGHIDKKFGRSGTSTHVGGNNITGEYDWAGNTLWSWGVHTARNRVPAGGEVAADWYSPQPCAMRSGGPPLEGLLCEEQLVRLLGQHRGTRMGRVDRWVGVFDVALITRGTLGWALDKSGYVVASGDVVSAGTGSAHPSLVTYTDGSGATRPVLVGESGLLSLGRAALADPSWLGPSVPGGFLAHVDLQTTEDSMVQRRVGWKMKTGLERGQNTSAHVTPWLQEVAYALCSPPIGSFVRNAGLCAGVRPRLLPSHAATLSADGEKVADSLDMTARQFRGQTGVSVSWKIHPQRRLVVLSPQCDFPSQMKFNDVRRQPIWLLGRGDREIPRAGWSANPAEADLARRLGSCRYTTYRRDLTGVTKWPVDLTDRAAELSQSFRRDLFLVDEPTAPASDTDIILAGLVVVPEAVTLLLLLLQPPPSPKPGAKQRLVLRALSLGFIVFAGGVSLLGIQYLNTQEQNGSNWRAAALRTEIRIAANETEQALLPGQRIDYSGRRVWHVESLFLIARPGYRPTVTRKLYISLSVGYGMLSLAVVTKALWGTYNRWRAAAVDGGDSETRDAAPAEDSNAATAMDEVAPANAATK